ncbi:Na(+)/H(+) antiporter subunit C [Corynebacterium ureicelerivorans]|uniref:Na(+)/H(+) antiporter subunit C n=1 Tax=Corynebacterium ureicelerivorans TaxID=401472 RepID=UPI00264D60B4|nr:Na(+)/H(+) antiporter subunit C [Corynebacterium ureicelerivorans]MDN8605565.1 Na(+)/H(+) antiporter subunit C [Corynebacterium ureicelerivorans]
MEANLFLLIGAGVLIACGVYLMLDTSMTRMIMGVTLIGNGANLLLLQSGGPAGSPPIIGRGSEAAADGADPLAQAMILTAIVISMSMVGFMLALAYRQYRYRTDDVVERDEEDRAVAARPHTPGPERENSDDAPAGKASAPDETGPKPFEDPVKEVKGRADAS